MRKVLYKKWIAREPNGKPYPYEGPKEGTGCWSDFIHKGNFHQWGIAYEDSINGSGNYTVALIETESGEIEEVFPSNVKFVSS